MTERAVVTREHRQGAHACVCPEVLTTGTEYWIASGDERYALWLTGDQKQALIRTAQSLADAEALGRAQANEGPVVAGVDRVGLEADVKRLRYTLRIAPLAVEPHRLAKEALSRIAAALGLKEPT